LQTTEIEESPVMDAMTLISNIGGLAGLFLGISFPIFVEIISTLIEIFEILLRKKLPQ
jgi:hypothetical protein